MAHLTGYIEGLVKKIGSRPATSQAEHKAATHISDALEAAGLEVETESFTATHSGGWVRALYYALGVFAAILAIFSPDLLVVALILAVVSVALLVLDILDRNPLFAAVGKGESQNVVGRHQPTGAVNSHRKVIIVAHYDSGRSMVQAAPFMVDRYLLIRNIIRAAVIAMPLLVLLAVLPLPDPAHMVFRIIAFFGALLVFLAAAAEIINLFMPYNEGANCNASGVAVLLGLARRTTGVDTGSDRPVRQQLQQQERSIKGIKSRQTKQNQTDEAVVAGSALEADFDGAIGRSDITGAAPSVDVAEVIEAGSPAPTSSATSTVSTSDTVAVINQTNPYLASLSSPVTTRVKPDSGGEQVPSLPQSQTQVPAHKPAQKPLQTHRSDNEPQWYKRARERAEKKAAGHSGDADAAKYRSKFADVPMSGEDLRRSASLKDLTPEEIIAAIAPAVASDAPTGLGTQAALGLTEETPRSPLSSDTSAVSNDQAIPDEHAATPVQAATGATDEVKKPTRLSDIIKSTPAAIPAPAPKPEPIPAPKPAPIPAPAPEPELVPALEPQPVVSSGLRDLDLPTFAPGESGKIAVQQTGLDTAPVADFDPFAPTDSSPVSLTGSFAPLGATGVMKPIGEELLSYSDSIDDLYIDDADDSELAGFEQEANSHSHAGLVDMPQSRMRSFFGTIGDRFAGRKREELESSPADWLGVDDDFDARTEGSQIGSWDNFGDDEDTWNGGSWGGESEEANIEALQELSRELIDREVWFVALGAQESKNAGLRALAQEHYKDFKGAIVINVEGVGQGDLHYTVKEGTFRQANTDHRIQNIINSSARSLGINIKPVLFKGYSTAATKALDLGVRAISIIGLDGDLPQGWRWTDDQVAAISEDRLEDAVDLLLEVIKNS